jgi:lipid-A-disaccharide synthase
MTDTLRIFVAAGELSGDLLGADLVRRLRTRGEIELSGIGGPNLADEGLAPLFPMSDLAVMGIADVVARFPLLWWRTRQTVSAILRGQPDVVVMIDSQLFSVTVAKRVRAAGYRGPMILYVAPSVWAFRPERAKELVGLFDEVLGIYHFEPELLKKLGGPPTTYVGHPVLARTAAMRNAVPDRGPLLLLPGSRAGELRRHLPLMAEVAGAMARHPRVTELLLPTPKAEERRVTAAVAKWPVPVRVVTNSDGKAEAFAGAVAAVAVAGTVTLELALAGVPMVVTYVGDTQQLKRWTSVGMPPTALPNILTGQRAVPDGVSDQPESAKVIAQVTQLVDDPHQAAAQLQQFALMKDLMSKDVTDPAERVRALAQRLVSGT